ncbi:MAG: cell envelope integrity protein CreD [Thiotrichaceae bacterium]
MQSLKSTHIRSRITQSLSFRTIMIAILSLLMLIPLSLVDQTIKERSSRYYNVLSDIASSWGKQQTLIGPLLVVPYVEHVVTVNTITDKSGDSKTISKDVFTEKTLLILPQELDINADLKEEYRKRGIYNSLVYAAETTLHGHFNIEQLIDSCNRNCSIKWDKAWISIGLSDTKAITETSRMNWDGSSIAIHPGTKLTHLINNGFHAPLLGLNPQTPLPTFKIRIAMNGSKGIRFAPLGVVSKANITSSWPHPSFQGEVLPKEKKITAEGFTARWQIPNLARNYPQYWQIDDNPSMRSKHSARYDLTQFTTGVDLFEPVTLYSKISRSTKYGILLIALTYITFLIFELTVKAKPHFVQYVLVGLALSLFYLLLVSLAEHIRFLYAYLVASGVTILLITLYSMAILKKKLRAMWIGVLLIGLYAVLYTLLHLEDYALLAGSALLLVVISTLMFVTRRIEPAEAPAILRNSDTE